MDGYGLLQQDDIHKWIFNQVPQAMADPKYCMLSNTKFYNTGTSMSEVLTLDPTDTGYDRQDVPDSAWNLVGHPTAYITETNNKDEISFGPSLLWWGNITTPNVVAFAIMRNSTEVTPPTTDGDIYFGGNLDSEKRIDPDTVAVFAPNNLKLQTINSVDL